MDYDREFLSVFNEYYPFERYIVKNPKSITYLFDDAILTEIFVPYTEIKHLIDDNGNCYHSTSILDSSNNIYVKIKGPAGVMRFCYFDFSDDVRENIRDIIIGDMGQYEYQSLYVDHDDGEPELVEMLKQQKKLIIERYGECNIKKAVRDNFVES